MSRFTIIDVEQKSEAWHAARLGRVTGSRAPMMMMQTKAKKFTAKRDDLRSAMALEIIKQKSGHRSLSHVRQIEHGEENEPICLDMYEVKMRYLVDKTGFLSMPSIMAGCSLDGHVNDFEGIVEAKCPESKTHLEYLRTKEIPEIYRYQCIHNLWVSGAQWCDFCSYDPEFPEWGQFMCVRMMRDEAVMTSYELALNLFLAEVKIEVQDILKLKEAA